MDGRDAPMKHFAATFTAIAWLLAAVSSAAACSSFCLIREGRPYCGQNYDWHLDDGLVLVNKRGLRKRGLVDDPRPAAWTSRYGSVTFNQYGREFPCSGMNEAGLVVIISLLNETRYPEVDERAAVNAPQWIQYQLDTARSVAEVLASDEEIRIRPASNARVHFFVSDRSGQCASIEFLDGEMVAHRGEDLPVRVLTNTAYERSLKWIENYRGFGGDRPLDGRFRGSRFCRTAEHLRQDDGEQDPLAFAFATLDTAAQGSYTKWSVVYDADAAKIHFRTRRADATRVIDLAECDFNIESPVKMLDINADRRGDVTAQLVDYSSQSNRRVVQRALRRGGIRSRLRGSALERVCRYPESCRPAAASDD
ncbi:MAG: linear amide C-N hydrolase [Planctomycetota bacterium]|nr:MAG: linear amide C-N hydrolase [Planctomycetota bacterium]REK44240.1 MAG: linear amide C-N hydrolase [Planctomycetota bacterium]